MIKRRQGENEKQEDETNDKYISVSRIVWTDNYLNLLKLKISI